MILFTIKLKKMKKSLLVSPLIFLLLPIFFFSCHKDPIVTEPMPRLVNVCPIANAGADQVIILPIDSILLDGTASEDPDGPVKSYQWKKIAGPTRYNFVDPWAGKTIVKDLVDGLYEFELTVADNGGLKAMDTMQVTVRY
jgi:hypothetical protein